jgi:hypothetical protein
MATIKLGELLIKANVLPEGQLKLALAEQQKWGGRLGEILVRMNFLTEDLLVRALSKQLAIPAVNLDAVQGIPPHLRAKFPLELARDFGAVPLQLRDEGKTLVVALSEPQNIEDLDNLRARTGCRIVPQIAGHTAISKAIARFYQTDEELEGDDVESSFKIMDAHGRTVIKSAPAHTAEPERPAAATPPPQPRHTPAPAPSATEPAPAELLRAVEEVQRKEVAALKAMVELLIEKNVFSREEYLARVKR